jgi:hypothetical protein
MTTSLGRNLLVFQYTTKEKSPATGDDTRFTIYREARFKVPGSRFKVETSDTRSFEL